MCRRHNIGRRFRVLDSASLILLCRLDTSIYILPFRSILDRLAKFVNIIPRIVTLFLPQVQKTLYLPLVFGTILERRSACEQAHAYWLNFAAY
jgi:hypothetical protein